MKRILAALALLASTACTTTAPLPDLTQTPPPRAPRFDDAIAAFEADDKAAMPPRCATLFVGASSIRFWNTEASTCAIASGDRTTFCEFPLASMRLSSRTKISS